MAKGKLEGYIKLQVPAGSANPSPPIGPALGQRGLNIMEFCKTFNARTQEFEKGMPIPVIITYYQDKSFSLEMKTPPASDLLKKAAGITKGSGVPNRDKVAKIKRSQARKIAEQKMQDMNATDLEMATNSVCGTARSMGIDIISE